MRRSVKLSALGVASLTVASSGMLAVAAAGESSAATVTTSYHACLSTKTHLLTDVTTGRAISCPRRTTAVSWAERGPKGAKGAHGTAGTNGHNAYATSTPLPTGTSCANGGIAVITGSGPSPQATSDVCNGDTGPSDAYENSPADVTVTDDDTSVASVTVPAGSYVATVSARLDNDSDGDDTAPVNCNLIIGTGSEAQYSGTYSVSLTTVDVMSISFAATLGSTDSITYSCQDNTGLSTSSIKAQDVHLIATTVGALHQQ